MAAGVAGRNPQAGWIHGDICVNTVLVAEEEENVDMQFFGFPYVTPGTKNGGTPEAPSHTGTTHLGRTTMFYGPNFCIHSSFYQLILLNAQVGEPVSSF